MSILSAVSPGWKGVGISLIVGALLGALAGWWLTSNAKNVDIANLNKDIATLERQHTADLKSISDQAIQIASLNAQKEHQFASEIAKADQKHTQELNNALSENAALRDDIASGAKRLRLAKADLATCRVTADATGRASAMGDGAAIEFSPELGRNIYDIRAGIIRDQQKLKYLQDYIRSGQTAGVIAK